MGDPRTTSDDRRELPRALSALSNETRLRMLQRLARPAFVADLCREFNLTRQAVTRHLEELRAAGLVEVEQGLRRGALPAASYVASPTGLFAFKERVLSIALPPIPSTREPKATRPAAAPQAGETPTCPRLLLVHGDAPGRWLSLRQGGSWIIGRDASADVSLGYDPFVSSRHAHLQLASGRWVLQDLYSRNGTSVNFEPLDRGERREIESGDLIVIGRSRLLLRED